MTAFLVFCGFAALFFGAVLVEWRATQDRRGFWTGPLAILAEIVSCLLRPF